MVRALLAILTFLRRAWLVELVGAGLVIAGVTLQWGGHVGLIAGGVALLLKAFEIDARTEPQ